MHPWKTNERFLRYGKEIQRDGYSHDIKTTSSSFNFFFNVNPSIAGRCVTLDFFFPLQIHHFSSNTHSDSSSGPSYLLEAACFDSSAGILWSQKCTLASDLWSGFLLDLWSFLASEMAAKPGREEIPTPVMLFICWSLYQGKSYAF